MSPLLRSVLIAGVISLLPLVELESLELELELELLAALTAVLGETTLLTLATF
jgi:hypothetical protein